jgi:hypothetical protein
LFTVRFRDRFRERLADGWGIVIVFLTIGAAIMGAYVHVTPFDKRANDIGSHVGVINMVERRHGIPLDTDCWECVQPPAYYLVAAAALAAAGDPMPDKGMPDGKGERILQGLSTFLGIATLGCWLMTARLTLRTSYERTVASALCAFWPTLPIQACKCSNDPMLYLLAAASLWQLVRWRTTGSSVSLAAAGALAGLAPHAKFSGFVVVSVFVASLGLALVRRGPGTTRRWPRGASAGLAAMIASLVLWVFVLGHYRHWRTHVDFSSTGHAPIENTWADFIVVHLKSFLENPWVRFDKSQARDEFWNYLFRSSLFGEYANDDSTARVLAYLLAMTAAVLLPLVAWGLVVCIRRGLERDDRGHRELALTVFAFIGFMLAVRLKYPIAPHQDFRFALPVVACCASMAAIAASAMHRKLRRRWLHLAALPGWLVVGLCAISLEITLRWS